VTTGRVVEMVVESAGVEVAVRQAVEMGVRADSIGPAVVGEGVESAVLVRMAPGQVQTIERTGKSWKAGILVSLVALTAGIGACSWAVVRDARALTDPPVMSVVGAGIFVMGLAGLIVSRVGAWWRHG